MVDSTPAPCGTTTIIVGKFSTGIRWSHNLTRGPCPLLTLQGVTQLVGSDESGGLALGVDMRQIGGHTGRMNDIVERQVGDQGILLEEQRQRLADSSSGTANGHLVVVLDRECKDMARVPMLCQAVYLLLADAVY